MKECYECKIVKPLAEFYKCDRMKDGHFNKCKACYSVYYKKLHQEKHDYYVEYYRAHIDDPKRKEMRQKYMEGCRASGKYKQAEKERAQKSKAKYPEKYKARSAVNNAIQLGKLKKGMCEICGNPEVEAHHDDYSKPLDIRWLCAEHHGKQHRKWKGDES